MFLYDFQLFCLSKIDFAKYHLHLMGSEFQFKIKIALVQCVKKYQLCGCGCGRCALVYCRHNLGISKRVKSFHRK